MEFKKNIHYPAVLKRPSVDGLQQMQGIHGLDQGDIRQHQFEFVGLEMADKMPLNVGGHLRHLGGKFLGTVLRKETLSRVIRLHEPFHGMEFGNRHQRNTGGNLSSQFTQPVGNSAHRNPNKIQGMIENNLK